MKKIKIYKPSKTGRDGYYEAAIYIQPEAQNDEIRILTMFRGDRTVFVRKISQALRSDEDVNTLKKQLKNYQKIAEELQSRLNVLQAEAQDQTVTDRLFIQEIINALHKEGQYQHNGKSATLLTDWSRELREKSGLAGKTKSTFVKIVGKNLYYP